MSDIKYKAYVTDLGKEKIAAALAEGTQVQITHMVVGDGTVDEPTADITELIGEEVWRGPVNSVAAKADDPNIIIIEVMVPGTVGGFWMREYACLDQDGEMIAWASMPPSYKTVPADGAIKSYALNMHIAVADSAAINLELGDDSVAASKQDIIDVRVEIEAARDAAADALAEHNEDPGVHPTFARKSDLEGLGASPATTAPPAVGTAAVGSSEDYARGDHNHALPGTVVLTSGAQTIAGAKTFSSNVIVPATPTANTHATSKQYVDAALAGKANLSDLENIPVLAYDKRTWIPMVNDTTISNRDSWWVRIGDLVFIHTYFSFYPPQSSAPFEINLPFPAAATNTSVLHSALTVGQAFAMSHRVVFGATVHTVSGNSTIRLVDEMGSATVTYATLAGASSTGGSLILDISGFYLIDA